MAKQILADDDDRCAGRSEVFLQAGVDTTKLAVIDHTGKHLRSLVSDQRHLAGIRELVIARPIQGVVGGEVQVCSVLINHFGSDLWQPIVIGVCAAGNHLDITIGFGVLVGQLGKVARLDIETLFAC